VALVDEVLTWAIRSGPGLVLLGPIGDAFVQSVMDTWTLLNPPRDTEA